VLSRIKHKFISGNRQKMVKKHIPFLRAVFIYSLTAFGGPQGHIGMMAKTFVQRRKDITEEELLEYNSFCQMLPGPSSTQTVMLIALKRGGVALASLTLLIWVLPASLIMCLFSFFLLYIDAQSIRNNLFTYIQPMSVGFVFYAAAKMMSSSVKYIATTAIVIGGFIITLLFRSPWVFPLLLLASGTISNFSNRRIPDSLVKPKKILWSNLWLFASIFSLAGLLSECAKLYHWQYGRLFNLFENFYRFGSFVFGGGQALLPLMLLQFASPTRQIITTQDLMTGYGLVQAVPGPVFSVCSFVGGLVMNAKQYGVLLQILGSATATIAVFLPSTLLLFFFFPIYQNLKHHVIIYRALEGISAVIVGIIWASGVILFQSIPNLAPFNWNHLCVIGLTFFCLYFTKIPAPLIVLGWLLLGLLLHQ
jgi:chromate transporter